MGSGMNKITVLAGKTMKVDITDCVVDLAISVGDLLYKINNNDIIIIEDFSEEEYEELKILLKGALEAGKTVIMYSPDNDEKVTGLADEMELPIYMYKDEVESLIR